MYPNESEGFLTKLRTKIVSGKSLSKIALKMKLNDHIRMNMKALNQNWNENPRILEDTFESIIGAIYLDMGLLQSKTFIIDQIKKHLSLESLLDDTNFKDKLMRYCHSKGYELPIYELINESGPNTDKLFTIQIKIEGEVVGIGVDKSKKEAEQSAAKDTLEKFSVLNYDSF